MGQNQTEKSGHFPLSLSQQNIWSLEQACPGTSINNICTTLRIRGRVDLGLLQQSVEAVLKADASLRTRITLVNDVPMQYHAPFVSKMLPVYDFSQTSSESMENWEIALTREIFTLLDAPLYRFVLFRKDEREGGILIKLHHIISDGWTQILLCNRIGKTYLDLLAGRRPDLGAIPDYSAYVQAETDYLASPACGRDRDYWTSVLKKAGEPSILKAVKSASVSPVGKRLSFSLPESLNNAIYSFCVSNRVAPFSVLYLALAVYFKRIGGADWFTIGVPIFNRSNFQFKQTSGMFVSTLPFINEISEEWSFSACNEHLTERWLDMLRHQRLPFSHIQQLGGKGDDGRLFHIALSYQNGQMLESPDAAVSFSGRWHYSGYQMEQLCIHLSNLQDDRRYAVDYDYLTQIFSTQEIQDLHTYLMNILRVCLMHPDMPISRLPVLSDQERERVVYTFNQTDTPIYDRDPGARLAAVTARHQDRAALIHQGHRTTYGALSAQSARVRAALIPLCESGELAAVMLPKTPDLFTAMTGILSAGCAFVLLPPDLPAKRAAQILETSGAAVLITDEAVRAKSSLTSITLPVITMDALPAEGVPARTAGKDQPAYVVYTSGSTGTPKGVEISRGSLLNLAHAMGPVYGHGAVLSLCSVGFDAFILESAAALLNAQTILLPEDADTESPAALAAYILNYGVGFLAITPSRLTALMKHDDFRGALRRVESIVCGGEAFPGELLTQLRLHTDARIYNQYGPSEATVAVSLKLLNGTDRITAGAPMANCRLYVLDRWMNPLPVGIYGDLYIGGVPVGIGYRNRPDLTAESFLDSPFLMGERIYRTGDTACWTEQGEIVLGGRTDRQVKLRGLRVEPEEVAACLSTHPQVKQCAALVREHDGQPLLAAYYAADGAVSEDELRAFAASYLPRYMVPAAIIRVAEIPLTKNGKVDESRLPAISLDAPAGPAAPMTPLEGTLLAIFAQVLHKDGLGAESDYFLNGGNSLNAMEAISRIGEETGYALRIADLYACRSARRLAAMLDHTAGPAGTAHLTAAPKQDRYPLSPIQQGIYVQSHMDPTGLAYHMPGAFRMAEAPDVDRLRRAFCALIAGEPLLRTAFVPQDDGIFACVRDQVPFDLPLLTGMDYDEACRRILAPFDLGQAPLLRAALWEQDGRWTLLLCLHHIIGDGMTTPVLMDRLNRLYQGEAVPAADLSYLDYAWQRAEGTRDADALAYWKTHLSPMPEPLELPADAPRGHHFDYRGDALDLTLDDACSAACDARCQTLGISPFMFFLGAFGILVSRLSGRQDLLVGAPAAGRLLPETLDMCGPFINTLPLRLIPAHDLAADRYLMMIRDEVNAMLDHQSAGLEDIAAALDLPRSLTQSPLYQVMFSQRPLDPAAFTLSGSPLTYQPIATGTAKMDLVGEMARDGGRYTVHLEYAASLFTRETVQYWSRCFKQIVTSLLSAENRPLGKLSALAMTDRITLIERPNHTVAPFVNLPVHIQIAQQAAMDPDAPALTFHGRTYTRREMEDKACRVAGVLSLAGLGRGGRVGLALKRGPELVAAMMGALKCGCAYVPLLATFPAQRLNYMIETAGITHILCDDATRAALPQGLACALIDVAEDAPADFEAMPLNDQDLCNILFTSGSTGKPKGVMLCHRSVCNMLLNIGELLARADGPILCTTNLVFDSFIGETLLPLAIGKQIVVCDEEEMMLPWRVAQIIEENRVEIVQFTPARFQMLLSNAAFCAAAKQLRMILFGGEVLTPRLLEQTHQTTDAVTVNMYGPTEATVYMTMVDVFPGKPISIGRPLKNGRIYVLDEDLKPVLPTAYGELWLAGEVLSLGYASRPDLTEEAFRPDPFFPGERMYRTGDIARMRLDGCYEFLGRRDNQVKLNGQRVELDEITGALMSSGCALLAATVPVRHSDGSMQVCSFYQKNPDYTGDEAAIRRHMGSVLPVYMMPSRLVALDAIPTTPSSKIDLRALGELAASYDQGTATPAAETAAPAPAQTAQSTQTAEPTQRAQTAEPAGAGVSAKTAPAVPDAETQQPDESPVFSGDLHDLEETLSALWTKALGRKDITKDASFFHQGGTSLAALSILSHYYNRGLVMSLQDFYEHPTIAQQARLLLPETQEEQPAETAQPETPAPSAQAVNASTTAEASAFESGDSPAAATETPAKPGTVFVTGATGFFGAHVVRELLESGADAVVCLLRGRDPQRLFQTLCWYFGDSWTLSCAGKIEAVCGDITAENLGLPAAQYRALCERVDAVCHCAADVRHYVADEEAFLKTNLDGTRAVIAFARAAGAPLLHVSTCSVSGQHLTGSDAPAHFTEDDFDIGQDYRANVYVKSKYLAEEAVYDAAASGLEARVFRLGRLVGRTDDGLFQKNPQTNAFYLTMRGLHALGAIPEGLEQLPVDLTPVDWCAKAMVALRNSPAAAYHLINPTPCPLGEAARVVAPWLKVFPEPAFDAYLKEKSRCAGGEVLAPLMDFWRQVRTAPPAITVTNTKTIAALKRCGFTLAIPGPQVLLRAFRYDNGERLDRR